MFKDRLKTIRLNAGVTQQEIAKELDTSYQTYQQWERGVRLPSFETTQKLADYFNVSADYLLGNIDDHKEQIIKLIKAQDISEQDEKEISAWLVSYFQNRQ
jgi:transcriptional regulator with XRE-family HTH domain